MFQNGLDRKDWILECIYIDITDHFLFTKSFRLPLLFTAIPWEFSEAYYDQTSSYKAN